MSVVVVGLEQGQAPLDLLEEVSVSDQALPKALAVLRDRSNLSEAVVVSTCQRMEVYAVVERFHDGVAEIQDFLASLAQVSVEALEEHLVLRFDDDVAHHLFSVAAGLESAVLGETEVLGQVRRSWERARDERACGPVLGALFRHAVETGKRVRSETSIARGITSLSHGAVALAADRRRSAGADGLAGAAVVVVGVGEMGAGVLQALVTQDGAEQPSTVTVVNRTETRARTLVDRLEAGPTRVLTVPFGDLAVALAEADVVFTTVATTHPIVDATMLEGAVAEPGRPPLLVVDLGVPRNVDVEGVPVDGVTVLDMDALRDAVEAALSGRHGEVGEARRIVADELERYRVATRARGAAPAIAALRATAESARAGELARRRAKRSDLSDEQWDQIDEITRATVAKLLHQPTVALKTAAGTARGERLIEALRTLFDL